jgi:hypothetical protein
LLNFQLRLLLIGVTIPGLLVGASACRPSRNNAARVQPTYDRAGRLQLLKYDADGDGRIDTWSYMNGATVVRIELDTDYDSTIDRWEYYGTGEKIEKVGSSRAQDGTPDSWAYYNEDGSIARLELSIRRDGTVDRIEHYENGQIARAEQDTNGDGRVDKWEVYEGSRLASVAFDTAQRGSPDRRLVYERDGTTEPQRPPRRNNHSGHQDGIARQTVSVGQARSAQFRALQPPTDRAEI